ncbi:hypothetical protein BWD09_07730 [Neisseria dentiae]|uniref:Lipoprotein n=1 Tax=Neisseria dentiae TaxID=194197 RepID=A0A1X3D8J6_9NEIS|nr:hypothetical protein [Neisseria dentiae]OSI16223.1 hypothetical protein BWD09_07730 [Neisseria dentiae]QMT44583.1 hypothetical protein H3L92_08990 [Neisseria dentiae]STZ50287.1 Uncharacterised protein [Neisseria dentiae]
MKKITPVLLAAALAACTSSPFETVPETGGGRDAHGCIPSAGYSWSALKQQCIQPFDNPDITFADLDNDTLAVYVLLSDDKSRAEVFASGVPENTILESVKGGYASRDGKIRLLREESGWRLVK